jgi:4-hydroxybenzoate polyprenyltransferase
MTTNWIKYLDYFFVTRPILFFPGWSTLLAGFLVSSRETRWPWWHSETFFQFHWWNGAIVISMLAFMAAMGASFILTQLQDVESDRKNRKLFLIGEEHIPLSNAIKESFFLIGLALVLGSLLNWSTFFLLAFFILITGYLYNYPPFQYKNTAIMGLILNMLMGWIAFALGWVLIQPLNGEFLRFSLPYLALNTGLYFLTTIPDMDGDRSTGKHTFPVRFGIPTTILACEISFFLSLILAWWNRDALILTIDLLTLPWMILLAIRRDLTAVIKTVKMAIFFFSILICLKFPLYFVLVASIFFLTRFYYRERFQFDYPNFRGE